MKRFFYLCLLFYQTNVYALPLDNIQLPPGFKIEIYADSVEGARSMSLSPKGVLYVGTRTKGFWNNIGKVYAVVDSDQDQYADEVFVIAEGLNMPNGVAFRDGDLYVAEINRILKFENIEHDLRKIPKPVVVNDSFPTDKHHGWKFIRFGPDGRLYIPVGAPCNVCDRGDDGYARIYSMRPDGSDLQVVAEGVRNSVGFDFHPDTGELWFTDNGRDLMGDDQPPDELNHASKKGLHFGYPYCHAGFILDPEHGKQRLCEDYEAPVVRLGAHVSPLGMRFYTGDMFPGHYQQQIFIAEHGSWNRSKEAGPTGYRITHVELNDDKSPSKSPGFQVFAEGWLQGDKAWGRPVDVLVMHDGALLVSDDHAGVIYRISYSEKPAK